MASSIKRCAAPRAFGPAKDASFQKGIELRFDKIGSPIWFMKRGEPYRVVNPSGKDPKRFRVLVIVSRPVAIESRFSTVICGPV